MEVRAIFSLEFIFEPGWPLAQNMRAVENVHHRCDCFGCTRWYSVATKLVRVGGFCDVSWAIRNMGRCAGKAGLRVCMHKEELKAKR